MKVDVSSEGRLSTLILSFQVVKEPEHFKTRPSWPITIKERLEKQKDIGPTKKHGVAK